MKFVEFIKENFLPIIILWFVLSSGFYSLGLAWNGGVSKPVELYGGYVGGISFVLILPGALLSEIFLGDDNGTNSPMFYITYFLLLSIVIIYLYKKLVKNK